MNSSWTAVMYWWRGRGWREECLSWWRLVSRAQECPTTLQLWLKIRRLRSLVLDKQKKRMKNNNGCMNGHLRKGGTDNHRLLFLSLLQVTYCKIDYSNQLSSSMLPILYVIVLNFGLWKCYFFRFPFFFFVKWSNSERNEQKYMYKCE